MTLNLKPYEKMSARPREKEMEVLCFGMSRTGTMSLYTALRKLGYTPYHFLECALDAKNNSLIYWEEAIQAKYYGRGKKYEGKDFDKMLWRYNAVTDIPGILFIDELLAAYPHAKVVITDRDVDTWLESMERSFYEILSWKRWSVLRIIDTEFSRDYIPLLTHVLEVWTGGDWQNRQKLRQGYLEHYQHVRAVVPKDGRLELSFKDGWEPLCKFLGKPVPEGEPYPHVNEGNAVANLNIKASWGRMIIVAIRVAKVLAPILIGIAIWNYGM